MQEMFLTPDGWPRPWLQVGVLVGVLAVGLFVHLGTPAVGLMEARNFVAAREIHDGGSWLLPTMNGALRLEKPPLPTWLVAVVMNLTGNTTDLGLLRLPSAIGASLLVLFFWWLGRLLTPQDASGRTAWLSALVLGSSLLLLTVGRDGNGWDVYCYCFVTGALAASIQGLYAQNSWPWLLLSAVLVGLSVLSKGPVALYGMLVPFAVAFWWKGPRELLRKHRWPLLMMLVVGVGVGCIWPLFVLTQHLEAASAVASTETSSWANRHVQPFWFYLNFPVFTGVWAVAAIAALVWPYAAPRIRYFAPYGLALAWLALTIILLSLVPEKKERYLLPALPPLALLMGGLFHYWLSEAPKSRADRTILYSWVGVLCLALLGIPAAVYVVALPGFRPADAAFWGLVSTCLVILVIVVAVVINARQSGWALVVGSLMVVGLVTTGLMAAYPQWEQRKSDPGIRLQPFVESRLQQYKSLPAYGLTPLQIKWVWAAGRPVPLLDSAALPTRPVLLYYAIKLTSTSLPTTWQESARVSVLDSFNLGRRHADGTWFIHLVE